MLGKHGKQQLLLQLKHSLRFQLADDLHALARHVAQGVGWIDVLHNPCKAVSLVETGCHPKQDLQSGMKRLTCHAFKLGS